MTRGRFLLLLSMAAGAAEKDIPRKLSNDAYLLPNGWALSPAGRQVELGGLPLKLTAVPHTRYVLAASNGYREHFLAVIDMDAEKVVQHVPIQEGWMGLAVSRSGDTVYASAGGQDKILVYRFSDGKLAHSHDIQLSVRAFPAGLAVSGKGDRLYVAGNGDHTLKVVDTAERRLIAVIPIGSKPYACVLSAGERFAYVSNWGEDSVSIVGLREGNLFRTVKVREKPNDMVLNSTGKRLFVANGNRNTVSVIDTASLEVVEEIDVALQPKSLPGSTPNALAFAPDGRTLYVANADNNCLAVVDVPVEGKIVPKGFIPTGWYPTAVVVDGTRGKLVVANGKGTASASNAGIWSQAAAGMSNPGYIAGLMHGSLSFIGVPDAVSLAGYSRQVHGNSPLGRSPAKPPMPPFPLGKRCPIKYVFYIIKENRTYDQIFGDMKEGNGDPHYCLFPEKITPNHHALARRFGLLDNLYHDAEVSADGHHWVTGAYATDYVEKLWPAMYGRKLRSSRAALHDDPEAFSAAGFIWDLCARAGISYRSYGEFARIAFAEPGTVRPATPSLAGHIHPTYYGADGIVQMSDRRRLELWLEEFRTFESAGEMPRFTVLSLPGDHLLGTRPGAQTPTAMMAENDFVLGKMIEALSASRFWKELAIFVVQDDTQDGPDHVDAHRAPALVVSPYSKVEHVDSTMYSSSSVLRTMELLLGLPPLTQYDAAATPMWAAFQGKPDYRPYRALPASVDLDEKNPPNGYGAQRSIELTLEVADTSSDREYNEIIWKAMRGADSPLPPRRVAAFVMPR